MADHPPPSLDQIAAQRWAVRSPTAAPWLHEEVGRRMAERLQWIRRAPAAWVDWTPVRGGLQAHGRVAQRYPAAQCWVIEPDAPHALVAQQALRQPWWRLGRGRVHVTDGPPAATAELLWSNMALHMAARPDALLAQWHRALAPDGFVMFSCLGPDTLKELRALHARMGWPPCAHDFTDMHDWGDMLVATGFAEPVMDMERITLTYATAPRLLAELRELGTNLSALRFHALRGRGWHADLLAGLEGLGSAHDGRIALTFEIIYGHAFKAGTSVRAGERTEVPLADMRALLRGGRSAGR